MVLKAGLVADFWNPPIPTTILATIHRIEVVRQKAALTLSGGWMPTGTWSVTPVERTPPLRGVNPNDPGAEHDVGLLFTVEISLSTTRTYEEIGTGVGDPGVDPGIERTRPREPKVRDRTRGRQDAGRNLSRVNGLQRGEARKRSSTTGRTGSSFCA